MKLQIENCDILWIVNSLIDCSNTLKIGCWRAPQIPSFFFPFKKSVQNLKVYLIVKQDHELVTALRCWCLLFTVNNAILHSFRVCELTTWKSESKLPKKGSIYKRWQTLNTHKIVYNWSSKHWSTLAWYCVNKRTATVQEDHSSNKKMNEETKQRR